MKQYLDLMKKVLDKGTLKTAARENMPSTYSLFGEQLRFNLSEGFPLITTKKLSFKNIVVELLWFLKGDTNIKYLVDNGCNIWNEDAYNYYSKIYKEKGLPLIDIIPFDTFNHKIKEGRLDYEDRLENYKLGDCGKQYGWLWRNWETLIDDGMGNSYPLGKNNCGYIDQIKDLIDGLKKNPMSRRQIITAWNPTTLDNMALNACHAFVQFNCRPVDNWYMRRVIQGDLNLDLRLSEVEDEYKKRNLPLYYLDCQMYQRSADLFLGVPYNIASYALLTEILCEICNMIPGEFVHTFGDVHIYDNHLEQVKEQLTREPKELPKLIINEDWVGGLLDTNISESSEMLNAFFGGTLINDFELKNYTSHPSIKGKLSTGLK
jgi:thymidylate synthase